MSFYIVILARINACIQAPIRQRYPFGKQKAEKGQETFDKQPSVNIRVVTKWYAKVPPANFCHRKPIEVLEMSYGARESCGGLLVKMQHKQHFFI